MRACALVLFLAGLAISGACGGQKPRTFRIVALEAEMRVVLPDASRRLACDARKLSSELLVEGNGTRTYHIAGCGRFSMYECETRRGPNDDPVVECRHPHTGSTLTNDQMPVRAR